MCFHSGNLVEIPVTTKKWIMRRYTPIIPHMREINSRLAIHILVWRDQSRLPGYENFPAASRGCCREPGRCLGLLHAGGHELDSCILSCLQGLHAWVCGGPDAVWLGGAGYRGALPGKSDAGKGLGDRLRPQIKLPKNSRFLLRDPPLPSLLTPASGSSRRSTYHVPHFTLD